MAGVAIVTPRRRVV